MKHRRSHYFLWFFFFGVIAGLNSLIVKQQIDSEAIWLLATGLIGLIIEAPRFYKGRLARPYDFLVGALFTIAGVIGILEGFKVQIISAQLTHSAGGLITATSLLGLSLGFFPSLIHAVLGLNSLNHAVYNR